MTVPNHLNYEIGQEVVPGYTLVRKLGKGFSGDVWEARAAGGTGVAVKVVRSLSSIGGRKELKALKALRNIRHPNLCPVHGFWTKGADGRLLKDGEFQVNSIEEPDSWVSKTMKAQAMIAQSQVPLGEKPVQAEQLIVVMGLGDCTLHDRLIDVRATAGLVAGDPNSTKVAKGLAPKEGIDLLSEAAKAIDLLNQKHKIYHCDIKPQNILMVGGGVQVCDFGLANKIEGDIRQTQHAFASPAYAAPEVLQGQAYSSTVDQYALAVTYFELRTGLLPFDATTAASMILAKCSNKLDLRLVSAAERKVLQKALLADPKQRYASCEELIRKLAIATGIENSSRVSTAVVATCLFVLAFLIAGVSYFWPSKSRIDPRDLYQNAESLFQELNTAGGESKLSPKLTLDRMER